MQRKISIYSLCLLFVMSSLPTYLSAQNSYELVDVNRIELLIEQTTLSYLILHLGKDKSHELLMKGAQGNIETKCQELLGKTNSKELREELNTVLTQKEMYDYLLEDDFDKENAEAVAKMGDKVCKHCKFAEEAVYQSLLKQSTNKKNTELLEQIQWSSGLALNLTQILRFALFEKYEIGAVEVYRKSLNQQKEDYEKVFKTLYNSVNNTDFSIEKLNLIAASWNELKAQLAALSNASDPEAVIKEASTLLLKMTKDYDELTMIYIGMLDQP